MKMENDMRRILIVDDDSMNLKVAKVILESNGYKTITAISAAECLETLKEEMVDLVLLDIEMPIMNGIKTLEYMRSHEKFKEIPVMFLTADADIETVKEAARLGAKGYVKKPFLPHDLLERVGQVIQEKIED